MSGIFDMGGNNQLYKLVGWLVGIYDITTNHYFIHTI